MSSPAPLEELNWNQKALAAIRDQAKLGREFDAYTLTEAGLPNPPHPNNWGSIFRKACNDRIITYAGHHKSRRPSRAGGACAYYVGTAPSEQVA